MATKMGSKVCQFFFKKERGGLTKTDTFVWSCDVFSNTLRSVRGPKYFLSSIKSLPRKVFIYHREKGKENLTMLHDHFLFLISCRTASLYKRMVNGSTYVGLFLNRLIYLSSSLIFRYLYVRALVGSLLNSSRKDVLQPSRSHMRSSSLICFISSFIYSENAKTHSCGGFMPHTVECFVKCFY